MELNAFSSYALLGSGRLARHLHFYLQSLNLPVRVWSRREGSLAELETLLKNSSHVLLAVSDAALAELATLAADGQTVVHFSGALQVPGAWAAHPLMTFAPELEKLDWYRQIPFVIEPGKALKELLPGLPNPSYVLAPKERAFYHALCSVAGNGSFVLWKAIGDQFVSRLNLPREVLGPFLHQVVENALHRPETGLTGPVSRGDWGTVNRHLDALSSNSQLEAAYLTYLRLARGET